MKFLPDGLNLDGCIVVGEFSLQDEQVALFKDHRGFLYTTGRFDHVDPLEFEKTALMGSAESCFKKMRAIQKKKKDLPAEPSQDIEPEKKDEPGNFSHFLLEENGSIGTAKFGGIGISFLENNIYQQPKEPVRS